MHYLKYRFQNIFLKIFWQKEGRIHLVIWSIFILYEVVIAGLVRGSFATPANYIVHYILNITLFYLHSEFVLIYCFEFRKIKAWFLALLILMELGLYILVALTLDWNLSRYTSILGKIQTGINEQVILVYVWRGLYFVLFGTGYYFFKKSISERNEKEKIHNYRLEELIEREKTEKELALAKNEFLLAQVNPHFLFNTLNFIYYKTYKESPDGAAAILSLSKIMRYTTEVQMSSGKVTIAQEIEYINNILEINQMRREGKIILDFSYDPDVVSLQIIPLVLITIVENIFKHGHLTQSVYPAFFSIKRSAGFVEVSTGNLSKKSKNLTGLNSGLKNIAERLKYEYGDEFTMEYGKDENDFFTLHLSLPVVSRGAEE